MIAHLGSSEILTRFGAFTFSAWYDGRFEVYTIHKGELAGQPCVPVRIHSACITSHYFNGLSCDCCEQMALAQKYIRDKQTGLIIVLNQEAKGNGILATANYDQFRDDTISSYQVFERMGYQGDARDYRSASFVIQHMKIKSVVLLSNSPKKRTALEDLGISVLDAITIQADRDDLRSFYQGKQEIEGHTTNE